MAQRAVRMFQPECAPPTTHHVPPTLWKLGPPHCRWSSPTPEWFLAESYLGWVGRGGEGAQGEAEDVGEGV